MTVLLAVEDAAAYYGSSQALRLVWLRVDEGEVVAVLGPNGAGKTTLLRAISRSVPTTGRFTFAGKDLGGLGTHAVARLGLGHVPEGRGTFRGLTVEDNLRLGQLHGRRPGLPLAQVLELFPVLGQFRSRRADELSGGQQQMLALARAMLGAPRLLLIDEPSVGLAPKVTGELYGQLRALTGSSATAVLLAEQHPARALGLADRAYVLSSGEVAGEGTADELIGSVLLEQAYLGRDTAVQPS